MPALMSLSATFGGPADLLGEPDLAHAALAEELEQPVRTDLSGGRVADTSGGHGAVCWSTA